MEGWEIILGLAILEVGLILKIRLSWAMVKWAWSRKVEKSDKEDVNVYNG